MKNLGLLHTLKRSFSSYELLGNVMRELIK